MGGCSSKPQTAECREVSLLHPALKASDSSAHQTLESLFNQHGRDGEELLEDAQTLHELLLHAVESKELPHVCENQSTENMPLTAENAENCTQTKQGSSKSNLAEKGAANLEGSLPGNSDSATYEICRKAEITLLDSPRKAPENHVDGYGIVSNVAEEKVGKSKIFMPDLAESKLQAEEREQSKFPEENGSKSIDLEPKSDLQMSSMSASPGCAEQEMCGLNLVPTSDCLKNLETIQSEVSPTNYLQKIEASESMESKEANPQALKVLDMKGPIEREEMAMETRKKAQPDKKCQKYREALQGEEVEEQSGKAMEGEETGEQAVEGEKTENARKDKKTVMQCAKEALGIDIDKQHGEAFMGANPTKTRFENGAESFDQSKKAKMEENTIPENIEEAMESEKEDIQDKKAEEATRKAGVQDEGLTREDKKTEVQNERGLDGGVEKLLRGEDGKALHTEKLAVARDEEIGVGAAQHCEAKKLDDEKDTIATMLKESSIESATTERQDDKSPSDPFDAREVKEAIESLEEHGTHKAAENSCVECVESKPNPKESTEGILEDANESAHMEASKQCNRKEEDLRGMK